MSKPKSEVESVLELLRRCWPQLFDPAKPLPLKLRIDREIVTQLRPDVSHKQIRRALAYWTGNAAYQIALARGGQRYGLDGEPAGQITEQHRLAAQRLLTELKARSAGA